MVNVDIADLIAGQLQISRAHAYELMQDAIASLRAVQEGDLPPLLTDERLRAIHHEDQFGLFCDFDEFHQIARTIESEVRLAIAAAGGGVPQMSLSDAAQHFPNGPFGQPKLASSPQPEAEQAAREFGREFAQVFPGAQPEAAPAVAQVPDGWKLVPVEPDAKAMTLMAGAILYQPFMTADNRHPYWEHAVEQAEAAYRVLIAAAPEAPARAGNAADVAARLVRELRDGTADKDPQAWMREAALTMQRLAPEAPGAAMNIITRVRPDLQRLVDDLKRIVYERSGDISVTEAVGALELAKLEILKEQSE